MLPPLRADKEMAVNSSDCNASVINGTVSQEKLSHCLHSVTTTCKLLGIHNQILQC